ncbi:hypothetical protein CWD92_17565 [Burkholderia thailandensis]|nr:hypothetical protein CWD92_17565 [Burkholderia thailandensis]
MMNSDAFFPFSDMFVTFEQVTGRAFSRRRHRHGAPPHSRCAAAHGYGAVQRKATDRRLRRSRV